MEKREVNEERQQVQDRQSNQRIYHNPPNELVMSRLNNNRGSNKQSKSANKSSENQESK